MKKYLIFIASIILLLPSTFAQKKLFKSDELLELTLSFDYDALQKDRGAKPVYHEAELSYTEEDGKAMAFPVRIRVRGQFRKDPQFCNFPPVHVKFRKDDIPKGSVFKGQRKTKLVTHCQEESSILKEYYIYKAYNLFTEASFRVRLARINYVDTKNNNATETRFAFFIEQTKHMAERNGGKELNEQIMMTHEGVERDMLTQTAVFQFMVANKDYTIKSRKNVKIITNQQVGGRPIVVPYDYDWAGMVNASYTKSRTSKETPKQVYLRLRKFNPLKICRSKEEYDAVVKRFMELQTPIMDLYKNSPYLDKTSVKESLKNLKDFYKFIKNSKNIEETFVKSCGTAT